MRAKWLVVVSASLLSTCLLGALAAQTNTSPRPPEAIASFDRAFKLNMERKTAEALAEFKRTVILDPTDSYAWFHIGRISAEIADHHVALLAFRNAVYTGRLRDDTLASAKEHVKTQMAAQQKQSASSNNPYPRSSFDSRRQAASLEAAGRRADAFEELKRAVILDQNDGIAWFDLGRLSDTLNDRSVAARAYRSALEAGVKGDRAVAAEAWLASTTAAPAGGSTAAPPAAGTPGLGGCRDSLTHLASRLPDFAYPDLRKLRETILSTRTADIRASMAQQGVSLPKGAAMMIEQSKEYVRVMADSKTCAVRTFAGDEPSLARALDSRQYDMALPLSRLAGGGTTTIRQMIDDPKGADVLTSCLRAFAAADMGKVATDESAVQLTCRTAARVQ